MKATRLMIRTVLAVGMMAGFAGTAFAQAAEPPASRPGGGAAAPADTGVILERAHDNLHANNPNVAAAQLREAAAGMREDAAAAPSRERKLLEQSAGKLDATAGMLEAGDKVDTRKADKDIAHGAHALAAFEHAMAKEAQRANDPKKLSRHLDAAANDLERAAKWTGRETERGVEDAVGGALELSGKLVEGVGDIPKDTGRVIDDLGRGIDRVGKDLRGKGAQHEMKN